MEGLAQWIGESLRGQSSVVIILAIVVISVVWIVVAYYWTTYWAQTKRVDLGGKKHGKK